MFSKSFFINKNLDFSRQFFKNGAGEGNRTPVVSLEGWSSTIELHLHVYLKQLFHSNKIGDPYGIRTRECILERDVS